MTPTSPRSYMTGNVFGPLTGTTFSTQQAIPLSISAAANLSDSKRVKGIQNGSSLSPFILFIYF